MPSEIAPCPVCGGAGEQNAYDRSAGQITCVGECGWAQPADVWNRLSRAATLLRAVESLETAVRERYDVDAPGSVLLDEKFIKDGLAWGEVQYGPLADALIALAGGGEQCSALSTCC